MNSDPADRPTITGLPAQPSALFDDDLCLRWANHAWRQLFGPADGGGGEDPLPAGLLEQLLLTARETGQPAQTTVTLSSVPDETTPLSLTLLARPGSAAEEDEVLYFLTATPSSASALADTAPLETLLEALPYPAAVLDQQLCYQQANSLALRAWGLTRSALLGRHHSALFPSSPRLPWETVLETGSPYLERAVPSWNSASSTTTSAWDLSLSPLRLPGVPAAYLLLVLAPAGEREKLVDELRSLQLRLREAQTALSAQASATRDAAAAPPGALTHSPGSPLQLREDHREFVENLQEGIWLVDYDNRTTYVNEPCARMLGYSPPEMLNRPVFDFMDDAQVPHAQEIIATCRGGESVVCEFLHQHRDGDPVPVLLYVRPVWGSAEEFLGVMASLLNLSELHQAQHALLTTEQRYKALLEHVHEGVIALDLDGRVAYANPAAGRLLGYDTSAIIGRPLLDFVPPDHCETISLRLQRRFSGISERYQTELLHSSGRRVPVEISGSPQRDADGNLVGAIGAYLDLTHRRAVEHEREQLLHQLRRQAAQLRTLFENLPLGLVLADEQGRVLMVNPEAERLYGSELFAVGSGDSPSGHTLCHADGTPYTPEELPLFRAAVYGERYDHLEMLLCSPAGARRFLEVTAAPLPGDEEGAPSGAAAAFRDITDLKATEQEREDLRFALQRYTHELERLVSDRTLQLENALAELRSERDLMDTLLDNARALIVVLDSAGRVQRFNRACEELTGYSRDEVLGRSVLSLIPPEDRDLISSVFSGTLRGDFRHFENAWLTRDGDRPLLSWSNSLLTDEAGDQQYLVSVGVDVTAHRAMERAVADSEAQYRELVETAGSIILRWDLQGRITFTNEYALHFFGYSPDELLGQPIDLLIPASDSEGRDLSDLAERLMAQPEAYSHHENENITKSGERRWVAWTNRVLRDSSGSPVGFSAIGHDRTAQHQSEQLLLAYQQRLRSLTAELGSAEERERRAIADAIHDNLVQFLGFAKMRLRELEGHVAGPGEDLRAEVQSLVDEAIAYTRSFIIDLSPPMLYELGLSAALQALVDRLSEEHDPEISFAPPPVEPDLSSSLRALLYHAVRELLINALKHSQAQHIEVTLDSGPDKLTLSVADDGVGFDPAHLRLDRREGGFGLFRLRERLHHLGGHLDIQSTPAVGTRLTLRIPLQEQPE